MKNFKKTLFCIRQDYKRRNFKSVFKAFFCAEFRAVLAYRVNHYVYYNISTALAYILHNRTKKKYNVDIYPKANIGEGFVIAHLGAIVIGDMVLLKENITIQSGVTLGQKDSISQMPTIEGNTYIGTGAKLLGGITIGKNVVIGANSVVLNDVPNNAVCVGIPAKVIEK